MEFHKGHYIAIGATAFISLWMLSGLFSQEDSVAAQAPVKELKQSLFSVQVERFHSQATTPLLTLHGETQPNRQVLLSSEVDGKVIKLLAREGDFVKKGQVILELDPQDKHYQLTQAKALLKQRKLEYKANKSLIGKGLQNQTRLAASESALAAAKAQVKALEVKVAATQIRAPFSGILEDRQVELGSYLRRGDRIIQLLDFNPFIIEGFVAEKDLHLVKANGKAQGRTIDGQEHSGTVRYVSSQANKSSRTFAVELEIPNPSERQANGVTADILIPQASTQAIYISPALLSLNDNGILGAKHVIDRQVIFSPIDLIKAEATGVWVSGLPNPVDLIIAGQSFVSPGEKVHPVYSKPIMNTDESLQQVKDQQQTEQITAEAS